MGRRAERLLAAVVDRLPAGRRDLGRALVAELSVVPVGRRTAWIAGGVWFVIRESAMKIAGYALGLVAAAATLVYVDRMGTSDDAGQVSLLVLPWRRSGHPRPPFPAGTAVASPDVVGAGCLTGTRRMSTSGC